MFYPAPAYTLACSWKWLASCPFIGLCRQAEGGTALSWAPQLTSPPLELHTLALGRAAGPSLPPKSFSLWSSCLAIRFCFCKGVGGALINQWAHWVTGVGEDE